MTKPFEIKRAVRRALPLQIAFVGPWNSGKTLSGILFAAGLMKPDKRLCVIDTERGRASKYSDNKRVMAAMPQGFDVIELDAPYSPKRFVQAIDEVEAAGYEACLIDNISDEWDGPGGCSDMAEEDKNMWKRAKLENKRLMQRIVLSDMHILCALKMQEKTKIVDKTKSESGKQEYINLGWQPVCEKNFFYPMFLAFSFDPQTHLGTCIKWHEDVAQFYKEPHLITPKDGEVLRIWNESGRPLEIGDQLKKRAHVAAQEGVEAYRAFFQALTKDQRKAIQSLHEEFKYEAEQADLARQRQAEQEKEMTV